MKIFNDSSTHFKEALKYTALVIVTFLILQSFVVVMHELTHSSMAHLLGYKKNPLDIQWGNPITLKGWDEGVGYKLLFREGHNHAAALIGVSPLIVHITIVILSFIFLLKKKTQKNKLLFHLLYWFVITNMMELIAYFTMRAFAHHGDIGLFNRGMGLSPWIMFALGNAALLFGLYVLFTKIMPIAFSLFAAGNRITQFTISFLTAFILFIWGSGLRVVTGLYPDPQWKYGLIGFAAFALVMMLPCPAPSQAKINPSPEE